MNYGTLKSIFVMIFFTSFAFQNCSKFSPLTSSTIYPFLEKPLFFADVQLVEVESTEDRFIFIFDIVVVEATPSDKNLQVALRFWSNDNELCSRYSGSLKPGENHFRYSCEMSARPKTLQAELYGTSSTESEQYFEFEIDPNI